MKNVTISRTTSRYKRERDNLRTATRLARIIDCCLPMFPLLREACGEIVDPMFVRVLILTTLLQVFTSNIMLYGLIKIDFAHVVFHYCQLTIRFYVNIVLNNS